MTSMFGNPAGIGNLPATSPTPAPAAQAAADPCRVVIGPVVLSYPKLLVPAKRMNAKPEDAPQFSAEFYVYRSNPRFQQIVQVLQAAVTAAAHKSGKFPHGLPHGAKVGIRDLAEKEGWAGEPGLFIRANSTKKPLVRKGKPPQPVVDEDEVYAGAIVYAGLNASAYEAQGNKGIKFYLNEVLVVADGPRLAPERSSLDGMIDQIEFSLGGGGMPAAMPPGGSVFPQTATAPAPIGWPGPFGG